MHTRSNYAVRTVRGLLQPEFLILYAGMLLTAVVVMLSSQNFGVPKETGDEVLSAPNGVIQQLQDAEVVAPAALSPADSSGMDGSSRSKFSSRAPAPSRKEVRGPDNS